MAHHDDETLFYGGLLNILSSSDNIIDIIVFTDIKEQNNNYNHSLKLQNYYDICKNLNINTIELNYKNIRSPFYNEINKVKNNLILNKNHNNNINKEINQINNNIIDFEKNIKKLKKKRFFLKINYENFKKIYKLKNNEIQFINNYNITKNEEIKDLINKKNELSNIKKILNEEKTNIEYKKEKEKNKLTKISSDLKKLKNDKIPPKEIINSLKSEISEILKELKNNKKSKKTQIINDLDIKKKELMQNNIIFMEIKNEIEIKNKVFTDLKNNKLVYDNSYINIKKKIDINNSELVKNKLILENCKNNLSDIKNDYFNNDYYTNNNLVKNKFIEINKKKEKFKIIREEYIGYSDSINKNLKCDTDKIEELKIKKKELLKIKEDLKEEKNKYIIEKKELYNQNDKFVKEYVIEEKVYNDIIIKIGVNTLNLKNYDIIFTHNEFGEYGNLQHKIVNKIIYKLKKNILKNTIVYTTSNEITDLYVNINRKKKLEMMKMYDFKDNRENKDENVWLKNCINLYPFWCIGDREFFCIM